MSRSPSEFQQQVGIAAGSSSGIRVNDPVVTTDGLVGKVSAGRRPHRAGDAAHRREPRRLGDRLSSHGAPAWSATAKGPTTLTLDRVQKSQVLREGDTVVTQGFKVGPADLDLPVRDPDRHRQRRDEQRGRPLLERPGARRSSHFDSLHSVLVLVPKRRNQP